MRDFSQKSYPNPWVLSLLHFTYSTKPRSHLGIIPQFFYVARAEKDKKINEGEETWSKNGYSRVLTDKTSALGFAHLSNSDKTQDIILYVYMHLLGLLTADLDDHR